MNTFPLKRSKLYKGPWIFAYSIALGLQYYFFISNTLPKVPPHLSFLKDLWQKNTIINLTITTIVTVLIFSIHFYLISKTLKKTITVFLSFIISCLLIVFITFEILPDKYLKSNIFGYLLQRQLLLRSSFTEKAKIIPLFKNSHKRLVQDLDSNQAIVINKDFAETLKNLN